MKPTTHSYRVATRTETWNKLCAGACGLVVPDEYTFCDTCLLATVTDGEGPDAGSCCSCYEPGYTREQVVAFLRRQQGETVVRVRGWGK